MMYMCELPLRMCANGSDLSPEVLLPYTATSARHLTPHILFPLRFVLYQAHAFQISSRQGADQLRTSFGQNGQSEVGPELPDLFQTGRGRFRHGSALNRTKGFLTVWGSSIGPRKHRRLNPLSTRASHVSYPFTFVLQAKWRSAFSIM
jgi:hypothetical protein